MSHPPQRSPQRRPASSSCSDPFRNEIEMNTKPVSKVLVLDNSTEHAHRIKDFCEQNDLVPLKVRKGSVMSVLKKNIDLGAVLYCDNYGDTPEETASIAAEIHVIRPELPIIIRRQRQATLNDLPETLQNTC